MVLGNYMPIFQSLKDKLLKIVSCGVLLKGIEDINKHSIGFCFFKFICSNE